MLTKFHGWALWALLAVAILVLGALTWRGVLTAHDGALYILLVCALASPTPLPWLQGNSAINTLAAILTRLAHPADSVEVTKTTTVTRTLSPPPIPVHEGTPIPAPPPSTAPVTTEASP